MTHPEHRLRFEKTYDKLSLRDFLVLAQGKALGHRAPKNKVL